MSSLKQKLASLAKPVGYFLIAISLLTWLVVFSVPFLELEILAIAGIITGLVIFAEICFFVGILLIGKEVWQKFKQQLYAKLEEAKDSNKTDQNK